MSATARAVAAGRVQAVEVLDLYLSRLESLGPSLNAVVVTDLERARADAVEVDRAVAAGRDVGPLAGVPVTVKEAFAVEGLPVTAGMPEQAGTVAATDAPAVALLRRAGAVILGKTNVPTGLADLQTDNAIYGRTSNPWNRQLSCGGSSGGSAAAVAAGLCAIDLGSDLSGSIRVPASWCGVYGLRPTNGLISKRGHLPWPLDGLLEPPTSVVGPLARSVDDLGRAFAALSGSPVPGARRPEGLRILVWSPEAQASEAAPVDEETAAVLERTVAALRGAGITVEPFRPAYGNAEGLDLGWRLIAAEITHGLGEAQWSAAASAGGPVAQMVRHHLADQEWRLRLGLAWDDALRGADAVVCPAAAVAAQPHSRVPRAERQLVIDGRLRPFDDLAAWSVLASLVHQPSVTLPAGSGDRSGMPVGVQLVGRCGGDAELLAVAAAVDAVVAGWAAPPGFSFP